DEQEDQADVSWVDRSTEMAILALQGPRSREIAAAAGIPFPEHFDVISFDEREGAAAGTGYTGEEGCEYLLPGRHAADVWDRLEEVGAPRGLVPCGLGARDTLRLE